MRRFQHVLEACGVNKALIKEGVREGDTVIVGEVTPKSLQPCSIVMLYFLQNNNIH